MMEFDAERDARLARLARQFAQPLSRHLEVAVGSLKAAAAGVVETAVPIAVINRARQGQRDVDDAGVELSAGIDRAADAVDVLKTIVWIGEAAAKEI